MTSSLENEQFMNGRQSNMGAGEGSNEKKRLNDLREMEEREKVT